MYMYIEEKYNLSLLKKRKPEFAKAGAGCLIYSCEISIFTLSVSLYRVVKFYIGIIPQVIG